MTDEPRLLIIEDDPLVAGSLRDELSSAGFRVVGVASRVAEVEPLVREQAPTIALVDIDLGPGPDGIEVARSLLVGAGVRVIFASAHADRATLARAASVDAHGFIVKPFSIEQLCAAIEIAHGRHATTPVPTSSTAVARLEVAQRALAELAALIATTPPAEPAAVRLLREPRFATLSDRERDVVLGLLENRRVSAIAEHLGISEHTVRNHLKAIFAKLHVGSQQELIDVVFRRRSGPPGT